MPTYEEMSPGGKSAVGAALHAESLFDKSEGGNLRCSRIGLPVEPAGHPVSKIVKDKEFQEKNNAMDMPVVYTGGAEFQKFFAQYKINVQNFLAEEGLVKK